jgi:hypothetical protein
MWSERNRAIVAARVAKHAAAMALMVEGHEDEPRGNTVPQPKACIPPQHVKSLLEESNTPLRSCKDHYCKAIQDYLAGTIDHVIMLRQMGTK